MRVGLPIDLLRLPALDRLTRWRWGRLVFQLPFLFLAVLVIYDGLTGPQLAPTNLATVLVWIHYRGLVVLALILVGNLFCMVCPFALLRTIAPRLARFGSRWPRRWRNRWGSVIILFLMFWLYEWLDLWASPRLTVLLALAYFVAAFALEILFRESPFCKYLCPLGAFNVYHATVAPYQICALDKQTCRTCENRECVNGSAKTLGCGVELYVPQIASNLDCLLCMDCARVCPHDNVALALRRPGEELSLGSDPHGPVGSPWRKRLDVAFLALMLAFSGVSNAFGMVPPVYELEALLAKSLGTESEALVLFLIFVAGNLVLPVLSAVAAALASRRIESSSDSLKRIVVRYAPAVVPLSLAIWTAHYFYHFATGALSIVPVFQNFALDHGLTCLGGTPNWEFGALMPADWLLPVQVILVLLGLLGTLTVLGDIGRRSGHARKSMLPWFLLFLVLALAAIMIFTLPMEMRGTISMTH